MGEYEKFVESDDHRRMRRAAFFAVVVSTVAVMASVITLPLVYNYVQTLQSHMLGELDFCKSRARDMWVEIFSIQTSKQVSRERREWLFGQWVQSVGGVASGGAIPVVGGGPGYGGYGPPPPPPPTALPAVQIVQKCKIYLSSFT